MEIKEEKDAGLWVVALTGRLDSNSSAQLETVLLRRVDGGYRQLIVDCSALTYISSAGLRVLFVALKRMKAEGGGIVLCAINPQIHKVLEISGVLPIFPIYSTRAEAMAS